MIIRSGTVDYLVIKWESHVQPVLSVENISHVEIAPRCLNVISTMSTRWMVYLRTMSKAIFIRQVLHKRQYNILFISKLFHGILHHLIDDLKLENSFFVQPPTIPNFYTILTWPHFHIRGFSRQSIVLGTNNHLLGIICLDLKTKNDLWKRDDFGPTNLFTVVILLTRKLMKWFLPILASPKMR